MSRRALRLALAAAAAPAVAAVIDDADAATDAVHSDLAARNSAVVAALAVETVLRVESAMQAEQLAEGAESVVVLESTPDTEVDVDVDAFARASGALGFAPVVDDVPTAPVPEAEQPLVVGAAPPSAHVAPGRRRVAKRLMAAGASFGVMGVAGLIAVSMTLPASAVAAVHGGAPVASLVAADASSPKTKVADDEIQAFVASAGVKDEAIARSDAYSTVSMVDMAAEQHIRYSDSLYTNDSQAAIQWPFMVGVAMSSPYGMRNGRLHAGIDLVPGAGATIQAIADGTVRIATESGGAYGVTAYVDHVIDGKVVTSHYSHMQHGSLAVHAGQKIKVGDTIGKVGNTGRSYGAHLHFEIIINGSTVDPLVWMRKNAGRYSY